MANLQLELDRNAAQKNIVVAQACCLSVCSSLVRTFCPSFAGGSRSACQIVDSSSDTTRLMTGLSLASFFDFAEVFFLALLASSRVEDIMIFGAIIWQAITCQSINRAHSWEV